MKLALQVVAVLIGVFLAYLALSAVLGYLIGALICIGLAVGAFALLRCWIGNQARNAGPDLSNLKRAEKHAEKRLREMEREANRTVNK